MTNDEAIKEFQSELRWAELNEYPYISKKKVEADKMAIKALKQESILNKIRAEIEKTTSRYTISRERGAMGQVEWSDRLIKESEVLQIIDKYKADSEVSHERRE